MWVKCVTSPSITWQHSSIGNEQDFIASFPWQRSLLRAVSVADDPGGNALGHRGLQQLQGMKARMASLYQSDSSGESKMHYSCGLSYKKKEASLKDEEHRICKPLESLRYADTTSPRAEHERYHSTRPHSTRPHSRLDLRMTLCSPIRVQILS